MGSAVVICPLCQRDVPDLQAHHLKTRRKDKKETEGVCGPCHSQIHALFSNTELRNEQLGLDTIEGLCENERMAKAIKWVAKQPVESKVKTKLSAKLRDHR